MFSWIRGWWITWHVRRSLTAEQWAILTNKRPFDPDDFVEVERPS